MSTLLRIANCARPNRIADVIFVHGLDGDAIQTWQSGGDADTFWPRWLGTDLPEVGIWSVDYEASSMSWKRPGLPLADLASNVLSMFEIDRLGEKPLCFVAHSLGGLLVKQILRHSLDFGVAAWRNLAHQTRGIVFLSTPHSGSDIATWLKHIALVSRTTATSEDFHGQDPRIRELNAWFRSAFSSLNIQSRVFFEIRKMQGIQVVDRSSADPGLPGVVPIAVDADHVTIGKPTTRDSFVYLSVKSFVIECLFEKDAETPAEEAEVGTVTEKRDLLLVNVFKQSGVPDVTFVPPPTFQRVVLSLSQPGRGLVIEGPSGMGKTTTLTAAIRQLQENVRILSARRPAHVQRISSLPRRHNGIVAIDDFHRLDADLRAGIVDYLKFLADTESTKKLVLVGIPGTGKSLVEISTDLATRIDVCRLAHVTNKVILGMIKKGEEALNVKFAFKDEIASKSKGSLNIAQMISFALCDAEDVTTTQNQRKLITTKVDRAMREVVAVLDRKFGDYITSFASFGGARDHTFISLLEELAFNTEPGPYTTDQGSLLLIAIANQKPHLARSIQALLQRRLLEGINDNRKEEEKFLFLDRPRRTLVVDDPQLLAYLASIDFARLAHQSGKSDEQVFEFEDANGNANSVSQLNTLSDGEGQLDGLNYPEIGTELRRFLMTDPVSVSIIAAIASSLAIIKDAPHAVDVIRRLGIKRGLIDAWQKEPPPPPEIDEGQPLAILSKGLVDELTALTREYGIKESTWDQVEREKYQVRVAAKASEVLTRGEPLLRDKVEGFDTLKDFFAGVADS